MLRVVKYHYFYFYFFFIVIFMLLYTETKERMKMHLKKKKQLKKHTFVRPRLGVQPFGLAAGANMIFYCFNY